MGARYDLSYLPSFLRCGSVLPVAVAFFLFGLTGPAAAQSYFTDCTSETGNNATVILPDTATIQSGDHAIEEGDEIAVFDARGRCVGAAQWTGEHITLTVWGANEVTPEKDGLNPGEPLHFRLWSTADEQEWGSVNDFAVSLANHKPYLAIENVYAPNRIYVIDSLRFERLLQASRGTTQ